MRVSFKVTDGVDESVKVSTRAGIVFTRSYLIRDGTGVVEWTPKASGPAVLLIRARGHQGQTATRKAASRRWRPAPAAAAPDRDAPPGARTRRRSGARPRSRSGPTDCRVAVARIEGPGGDVRDLAVPVPRRPGALHLDADAAAGRYLLTAIARGDGTTTQATT